MMGLKWRGNDMVFIPTTAPNFRFLKGRVVRGVMLNHSRALLPSPLSWTSLPLILRFLRRFFDICASYIEIHSLSWILEVLGPDRILNISNPCSHRKYIQCPGFLQILA